MPLALRAHLVLAGLVLAVLSLLLNGTGALLRRGAIRTTRLAGWRRRARPGLLARDVGPVGLPGCCCAEPQARACQGQRRVRSSRSSPNSPIQPLVQGQRGARIVQGPVPSVEGMPKKRQRLPRL